MLNYGTALVILGICIVCVAASQVLLKARMGALGMSGSQNLGFADAATRALSDPLTWVAGSLVVIGAGCWYLALTRLPLSLMLPVAGLVAPIVAIAAHFALDESLSVAKLAAIFIIAIGVIWLGFLQT